REVFKLSGLNVLCAGLGCLCASARLNSGRRLIAGIVDAVLERFEGVNIPSRAGCFVGRVLDDGTLSFRAILVKRGQGFIGVLLLAKTQPALRDTSYVQTSTVILFELYSVQSLRECFPSECFEVHSRSHLHEMSRPSSFYRTASAIENSLRARDEFMPSDRGRTEPTIMSKKLGHCDEALVDLASLSCCVSHNDAAARSYM
ncbi:hypothetical protein A2U01_0003279, partial [Trifolium medium]|nr:hypothetical protein [Trifolium medium]